MDLKPLINKPDNHPYTLEESYFLINRYLLDRKGVDIQPNIMNGIDPMREIRLLHTALNIIIGYYRNEGISSET